MVRVGDTVLTEEALVANLRIWYLWRTILRPDLIWCICMFVDVFVSLSSKLVAVSITNSFFLLLVLLLSVQCLSCSGHQFWSSPLTFRIYSFIYFARTIFANFLSWYRLKSINHFNLECRYWIRVPVARRGEISIFTQLITRIHKLDFELED